MVSPVLPQKVESVLPPPQCSRTSSSGARRGQTPCRPEGQRASARLKVGKLRGAKSSSILRPRSVEFGITRNGAPGGLGPASIPARRRASFFRPSLPSSPRGQMARSACRARFKPWSNRDHGARVFDGFQTSSRFQLCRRPAASPYSSDALVLCPPVPRSGCCSGVSVVALGSAQFSARRCGILSYAYPG